MTYTTLLPAAMPTATRSAPPGQQFEMALLLDETRGREKAPAAPPASMRVQFLENPPPRPPGVGQGYRAAGVVSPTDGKLMSEIRWIAPGAPLPRASDFADSLMPAIDQILLRIFNENPHAIVEGMTSSAFQQFRAQQARAEAGLLSPLETQSFLEQRNRLIDFFTNPPAQPAPQPAASGAGGGSGSGRTIGPLVAQPEPDPAPAAAPREPANNFPVEYVPPPVIDLPRFPLGSPDFSQGVGIGDPGARQDEPHLNQWPGMAGAEGAAFNQWPRGGESTELPLSRRQPYTPAPDAPDPVGRPAPLAATDFPGYQEPGEYVPWTGLGRPPTAELLPNIPISPRERDDWDRYKFDFPTIADEFERLARGVPPHVAAHYLRQLLRGDRDAHSILFDLAEQWGPQGVRDGGGGGGDTRPVAAPAGDPEGGGGPFSPAQARAQAAASVEGLRERSARTGEPFETLLEEFLDRLSVEDPRQAVFLRVYLKQQQIPLPATGGFYGEPRPVVATPLEQLSQKLAELGRSGDTANVRERVQQLVEDIKIGHYPVSHPQARQNAVDILAGAAREGLAVDGLRLAFTLLLAQTGAENAVETQLENARMYEEFATVGQREEIGDGVLLTLNADRTYTIEVTHARMGQDPTVYYKEPGTGPGEWSAVETGEGVTVAPGTLFRVDNSPYVNFAGAPEDYDGHLSLIDPVAWGQDLKGPELLRAQFLDRLNQILRMENLTAGPKAEIAHELFRELAAQGLASNDPDFVTRVIQTVDEHFRGSASERDLFLQILLDAILGFGDGSDS